jgi:hypothetical protein
LNQRDGRAHRHLWHMDQSLEWNLNRLDTTAEVYNNFLKGELGSVGAGMDWHIDEFAILMASPLSTYNLVRELVRLPDVEIFNAAGDTVRTSPFGTSYRVEYIFLRTGRGYRLEVMNMAGRDGIIRPGFSPLHSSLWGDAGNASAGMGAESPRVAHASFKCADHRDYDEALRQLALFAQHGQSCESSYGRFSYWLPYFTDSLVYLKPRVNIRDQPKEGGLS